MGLEAPTPIEQDAGHTEEWSHMSDYDDAGMAPGEESSWGHLFDATKCSTDEVTKELKEKAPGVYCNSNIAGHRNTTVHNPRRQEHREESGFRATNVHDEAEYTRECEWKKGKSDVVLEKLKTKTEQIDQQLRAMAGTVACFSRCCNEKKIGNKNNFVDGEESDDGEDGRLVCNMIGQG